VKKLCFYLGLVSLFFVFPGTVFAQTMEFEYDVSQKYPIYTTFDGNISVASEMTGWFYDDRSWHFIESEWTCDENTGKYKYSGSDKNNWITDAGITLPRPCVAMQKQCKRIKMNELKTGDLILFDTGGFGSASHVAIYMGNKEMIHSYDGVPSSKRVGVAVTKMEGGSYNKWWKPHEMFGLRILAD
jgi:hypothetical protein